MNFDVGFFLFLEVSLMLVFAFLVKRISPVTLSVFKVWNSLPELRNSRLY